MYSADSGVHSHGMVSGSSNGSGAYAYSYSHNAGYSASSLGYDEQGSSGRGDDRDMLSNH